MTIARNLDGISVSARFLANVVTGVACLAKLVVTPAQNAQVARKHATVTRPHTNLRSIVYPADFHNVTQSLWNLVTELPQKIVAAPTIDFALPNGARMI
jgi:hypothetical protein